MNNQTIVLSKASFEYKLKTIIDKYKPTDELPVEYELAFPEPGQALLIVNGDHYLFEVTE